MTRIAAGHPGIWPDICTENRAAIVDVLGRLEASLAAMRERVAAGDRDGLLDVLERARSARVNLPARVARPERMAEVRVPVPDRPGVIAEITTLATDLDVNIADFEIAHSSEGQGGVVIMLIDDDMVERFRGGLLARGYRPSARGLT
jgi:prephenate dehydrogenase